MIDLGTVRPCSTIRIPVNTFDSNDPAASVTATTWLNTDCHIHKDGSTTQRASSAGETLSIDFDTVTGNHILELDLSDNTTANFYEAGSEYHVRIEGVTVDAGNINAWIARFRIGYDGAALDTTIATLASQVSFTLEDGSADNDAYNGCRCTVHDLSTAEQIAFGVVSDYVGSTKTVTLKADPGIFTMAAGDNISIFPPALTATTPGSTLDVTSTGAAGIDWGNVENPTTAVDLAGTDIQLCDTITTYTGNTVQTGDAFARLGAPAGASVSADIATVDTVADGIQTDLDNATDGLGALKTLIDAIQTDLDNGTDGLGALKTLIDTVDTVVDAIKVVTDALGSTAATQLSLSANQIITFTVDTATNSHTPTTTEFQADDITEATTDHYKGRIVIFTSGVLAGQASDITAYSAVGGIGQFTVTAMTEAASNNDAGIIV